MPEVLRVLDDMAAHGAFADFNITADEPDTDEGGGSDEGSGEGDIDEGGGDDRSIDYICRLQPTKTIGEYAAKNP